MESVGQEVENLGPHMGLMLVVATLRVVSVSTFTSFCDILDDYQ